MNIVPVDAKVHAKVKVRNGADLSIVEDQHAIPLVAHELSRAVGSFPCVFLKNEEMGRFQLVGLMGLAVGENLYVEDGEWKTNHYPLLPSSYPFKLIPDANDDKQLVFGIDQDSKFFDSKDGDPLYNEDGSESEMHIRRRDLTAQLFEQTRMTAQLTEKVAELELLEARSLSYEVNGKKASIDGFFTISEEKLNALPDDVILELFKNGSLSVIYASMMSMQQVGDLVKRKHGKTK